MRFSKKVLELTKKIPRGKITTYKIIAEKLNTRAYRAVGTALHKNKKPIIIPCHRVVNSDGFVGNYGKGIKRKIELLRKERIKIKNKRIQNFEKVLFRF
ncbi:MAG TPA: MGMT family protein [Candidatus Woesearchaeota archaeon]|nr:MGMT family protein [Candidatus Woesearchaeota archaeon]